MRRSISCLVILITVLLSSTSLSAEENGSQESDFATVKFYFVNMFLPDTQADDRAGNGGGGLGAGAMRFETADLFLDDKLVSNIMFRHVDVTPTLNLPSGDHAFRIECEGYRKFERTLTVLGNGSVQWLVVRLEREPKSSTPVNRESAKR